MDGCCRWRLHSGTHIGRNHRPTAVTATVVRRHQNASLNPTRRAGSTHGRSLTLREHGELRTPASGSIDPRAQISPIISSSRRHSPRTKLCMRPSYVLAPRHATGFALIWAGRGAARRWGALWRLWVAVPCTLIRKNAFKLLSGDAKTANWARGHILGSQNY